MSSKKPSKLENFLFKVSSILWMPVAVPIFFFSQYVRMRESVRYRNAHRKERARIKDITVNEIIDYLHTNAICEKTNWHLLDTNSPLHRFDLDSELYKFTKNEDYPLLLIYDLKDKRSGIVRSFSVNTYFKRTTDDPQVYLEEIKNNE